MQALITISEQFTPVSAILGGSLIGAAASWHMSSMGRVLGFSGIISGMINPDTPKKEVGWRKGLVGGSLTTGALAYSTFPEYFGTFEVAPAVGTIALGGALVGYGTQLGSGCTSGHGVCGLARFSKRSMAAVTSFLGAGMITATAVHHVDALQDLLFIKDYKDHWFYQFDYFPGRYVAGAVGLGLPAHAIYQGRKRGDSKETTAVLASFLTGSIASSGLVLSQMVDPSKVNAFLDVLGDWDPSLALVMGGAMGVNATMWWGFQRKSTPLFDDKKHLPTATEVTPQLVVGSGLFGAGWGLIGFCPGPGKQM